LNKTLVFSTPLDENNINFYFSTLTLSKDVKNCQTARASQEIVSLPWTRLQSKQIKGLGM